MFIFGNNTEEVKHHVSGFVVVQGALHGLERHVAVANVLSQADWNGRSFLYQFTLYLNLYAKSTPHDSKMPLVLLKFKFELCEKHPSHTLDLGYHYKIPAKVPLVSDVDVFLDLLLFELLNKVRAQS